MSDEDFITTYLDKVGLSEVPVFFNRWSAIAGLGAWLGRDVWFNFGNFKIYPNIYAMLLAEPGVKKSTAIKNFKKVLAAAGYDSFAAEKTSKEKFLLDLSNTPEPGAEPSGLASLDQNLWGHDLSTDSNVFICADEFNDFFGNNINEFVSLLGVLWDYEGVYESKIKNGSSVTIPNPCVSILSGNTPATFFNTFGQEVLGQGFFSRLLFIHADNPGRKIWMPPSMSDETLGDLSKKLLDIKNVARGEIQLSADAAELVEAIYMDFSGLDDARFAYYVNRRQVHLLKLCIIHALADLSTEILPKHVVRANTILSHTEFYMPRALGEFGRARNSEVVHKVLTILENSPKAITGMELWGEIYSDLGGISEMGDIIQNLVMAGKIQQTELGILPLKKVKKESDSRFYNWSYLTDEERGFK